MNPVEQKRFYAKEVKYVEPSKRSLFTKYLCRFRTFGKWNKYVIGARVLDAGSCFGTSFFYLKNYKELVLFDLSPELISNCRNRIKSSKVRFVVGDITKGTGFPSNYFDVVICNGLLHHCDAVLALKEIKRVLKKGGFVLLKEPLVSDCANFSCVWKTIFPFFGKPKNYARFMNYGEHPPDNEFCFEEFERMVEKTGFSFVDVKTTGFNVFPNVRKEQQVLRVLQYVLSRFVAWHPSLRFKGSSVEAILRG